MSEEIEILYKNLNFRVHKQFNSLELVIDEANFSTQKSYISSASLLLELALTISPKYIILNREKYPFKVAGKLHSFTINNIILPLKHNSIKKIICTGSKEEFENRYKEIEQLEPFIKWVDSKASAFEWIKNNEEQNPDS